MNVPSLTSDTTPGGENTACAMPRWSCIRMAVRIALVCFSITLLSNDSKSRLSGSYINHGIIIKENQPFDQYDPEKKIITRQEKGSPVG